MLSLDGGPSSRWTYPTKLGQSVPKPLEPRTILVGIFNSNASIKTQARSFLLSPDCRAIERSETIRREELQRKLGLC